MSAEFIRDAAATVAIFGFFAASWFGWAQEKPPPGWRDILIAGSMLSLLVAVAGAILTWQHWAAGTAFNPQTGRSFGLIVGIEFAVAGLGAGVLAVLKRADLISAWVALVVGVHLFPLAPLLQYPLLYVVAALVSMAALVAVPLARSQSLAVSAITGLATGVVLLAAALFSLVSVVA
jgi:hypothetical protein